MTVLVTSLKLISCDLCRYAITVWYFDDVERQQARLRYVQQGRMSLQNY